MYKCSKCGKLVKVDPSGKIDRDCEHKEAAVIANVSAKLVGKGKFSK